MIQEYLADIAAIAAKAIEAAEKTDRLERNRFSAFTALEQVALRRIFSIGDYSASVIGREVFQKLHDELKEAMRHEGDEGK